MVWTGRQADPDLPAAAGAAAIFSRLIYSISIGRSLASIWLHGVTCSALTSRFANGAPEVDRAGCGVGQKTADPALV
jgi:hypothetical protein